MVVALNGDLRRECRNRLMRQRVHHFSGKLGPRRFG
jgi:hypothetical protein